MIAIVDYGLGNVKAFSNMYSRLNIPARTVSSAEELTGAEKIILPGVGHFDYAMDLLDRSGMRSRLDDLVLERQVPVVGICIGMQILAESSEEGTRPGLGWIKGRVRSLRNLSTSDTMPLPHMGWNDVVPTAAVGMFDGLGEAARFYFLHSFYFDSADPAHIAATANYGRPFPCAVSFRNVHGVQFHPEKSHHWGARLLQNFSEIA